MTDLQIDLLKVLKYIDDNSAERMFPYIRTISSFINCNPYSTFIEIIKKYKDICSKKYSLGQRKIEEELTNLCSLGFVGKKSIKGHKILYSLTSQGKLEVQNILSNANVEKSNESISDEAMKILRNKFAYLNEIQNTDFLGHDSLPFKKKEDEDYETMMLEVFKETNIYSYASSTCCIGTGRAHRHSDPKVPFQRLFLPRNASVARRRENHVATEGQGGQQRHRHQRQRHTA